MIIFDYIRITQHCKDTPFFENCTRSWNSLLNGCEHFKIRASEKELGVSWNPQNCILTIEGSLPYFLKGHNFSFSLDEYKETIILLQSLLRVGLWDAVVEELEIGSILDVPFKSSVYITNHSARSNFGLYESVKGKDCGRCKIWERSAKDELLKLYDVKSNFGRKLPNDKREQMRKTDGYDPKHNYLKFEVHILKANLLNGGQDITAEDLTDTHWIKRLNELLIEQYKLLQPMTDIIEPTKKKNYTALDIVVSTYAQHLMNEGTPIRDVRKHLYRTINQSCILNKTDKDSRKAAIRKSFQKMKVAEQGRWDLAQRIQDSIGA